MAEDAMIAELRARFDENGNNNINGNANAIVAATPPVPPLTIPPKGERTLSHLHVSFRIGARVSANFNGRDYNGEVKVKNDSNTGNYSVEFDDITSPRQFWQTKILTVAPQSWKEDPPARFLTDLKESKRLKTRVSHYHGGKQFVGTVDINHGRSKYSVNFDAGQELPFKSDRLFPPGLLQLGDNRQMAELPRTKRKKPKKVAGKKSRSGKSSRKTSIIMLPTAASSATQPVATLPTSSSGNGNDFTYVFGSDSNSADTMAAATTTTKKAGEKAKERQRVKEKLAKPPSSVLLSSLDTDDRVGRKVVHYRYGIGYEGEIASAEDHTYEVMFDVEVPLEQKKIIVSHLVLPETRKRKEIDSDGDSSVAEERPAKQQKRAPPSTQQLDLPADGYGVWWF